MEQWKCIEFEVFGRVQGVNFRSCTQRRATELGLAGYVRNTNRKTVEGYIEGPTDAVLTMMDWLQHLGSPHSYIERCVFRNENSNMGKPRYNSFCVLR